MVEPFSVVRSDTSDDWFFQVDPGFRFPVGATPADVTFELVKPEPTPDVANYSIGGKFDRNLSDQWYRETGGSWDRNDDAGSLNRYIAFWGVGHTWSDTADRRFLTSWGFSYTDREEETPDPGPGSPNQSLTVSR